MQRFYAVLEPEGMAQHEAVPGANNADIPFSQNVAVGKLPFTSAAAHYRNIEAGVLRGTSLWVDFPYPTFPENMGHWAEVLLPIYSQLSDASWRQHAYDSAEGTIRAVVFPNLRREQVQASAAGCFPQACFPVVCCSNCCGTSNEAGSMMGNEAGDMCFGLTRLPKPLTRNRPQLATRCAGAGLEVGDGHAEALPAARPEPRCRCLCWR